MYCATCYDNNGNLWVSNSFVNEPLSVYTADGEWMSFNCGSFASNQLCTDILVDPNYGYVWMSLKVLVCWYMILIKHPQTYQTINTAF